MRKEGWFQNANAMGGSDVVAVIVDVAATILYSYYCCNLVFHFGLQKLTEKYSRICGGSHEW